MSQKYIEYEDYKKMIDKQEPAKSPKRNIFQQNRQISHELSVLKAETKLLKLQILRQKNINISIINAIGRVFSNELAQQLIQIIQNNEYLKQSHQQDGVYSFGQTIYQVLATHHSQFTNQDWMQSRRNSVSLKSHEKCNENLLQQQQSKSIINNKSPLKQCIEGSRSRIKSLSRSPFSSCSILDNSFKCNDPSTNRSNNVYPLTSRVIATGINCELCDQTFAPRQFLQHSSICRQGQSQQFITLNHTQESGVAIETGEIQKASMLDTQDQKLKNQSNNYLKMMKNLMIIQKQIEQQIQLLKFSKQKIDRDAEKRKLEKELAKVLSVIQQKKKEGLNKQNDKLKAISKASKMKKNKKLQQKHK